MQRGREECEAELRRNRRLTGAASTLLLSSWGLHSHFESQTDSLVKKPAGTRMLVTIGADGLLQKLQKLSTLTGSW